ncbi:MAG: hypothetical protein ACTHNW_15270 [Mucilaginibacter sp.]
MEPAVSLQINLAPGDYLHARYILLHQLQILANQVNEIVLTVDTKPGKGRFAEGWHKYSDLLNEFLENDIRPLYNHVRIVPVDYSVKNMAEVAGYFFDAQNLPVKDFRGGPFYAYFFGLMNAQNDIVFHLDADMMLGGSSSLWVNEAVGYLQANPQCFTVSPLAGPPHPDDILIHQSGWAKSSPYTFSFDGMSTRIFMLNKAIFKEQKLTLRRPSVRNQIKALVEGNSNADLPEHLLSVFMQTNGLKRIDFLGSGDGLWSLHPPYRSKNFYDKLPEILARIDNNDMPPSQYGFYDVVDELCDWGEAREKLKQNRWWKRLSK